MGPWHERRSQAGRPDAEVLPASQRDPASVATTRLRRRGQPGRAAVAPQGPRGAAPALVAADPQGLGPAAALSGDVNRRELAVALLPTASLDGLALRTGACCAARGCVAASWARKYGRCGRHSARRSWLSCVKPRRCIPDCRTRATGAWTRCCAPPAAGPAHRAGLPQGRGTRDPAARGTEDAPGVRRRSAAVARGRAGTGTAHHRENGPRMAFIIPADPLTPRRLAGSVAPGARILRASEYAALGDAGADRGGGAAGGRHRGRRARRL